MLQQSVLVTIVLFVAGLIYNAGRLTERLEHHRAQLASFKEEWQREVGLLRGEIGELREMLRAAISERRNWREHDGG
jgi:hypothetical protein